MSFEAVTLRKHADQDWPESWACHEAAIPFAVGRQHADEAEWNVVKFHGRRQQSNVGAVVLAQPDASVVLRRLADEWKVDTLFKSSIEEMVLHPAYQQIIGFGEKALPFLFDELRVSDDYWFWALKMITRENPVLPNQNGDYRAMKQAWLDWGAVRGL